MSLAKIQAKLNKRKARQRRNNRNWPAGLMKPVKLKGVTYQWMCESSTTSTKGATK